MSVMASYTLSPQWAFNPWLVAVLVFAAGALVVYLYRAQQKVAERAESFAEGDGQPSWIGASVSRSFSRQRRVMEFSSRGSSGGLNSRGESQQCRVIGLAMSYRPTRLRRLRSSTRPANSPAETAPRGVATRSDEAGARRYPEPAKSNRARAEELLTLVNSPW